MKINIQDVKNFYKNLIDDLSVELQSFYMDGIYQDGAYNVIADKDLLYNFLTIEALIHLTKMNNKNDFYFRCMLENGLRKKLDNDTN